MNPISGQVKEGINPDARPWVFWYWIKAGVSKAGITADLEAMKEAGIGGAYLMPIQGASNPPLFKPAVEQLSPEWWDMMRFSFAEAKRLGLQLGMHVSDGFALAGGLWITPELSMQKVVSVRSSLTGGKLVKMKLAQPETIAGYYKDIAVYAYPELPGSDQHTSIQVPLITTSLKEKEKDAQALVIPGNKAGFKTDQPCWIQYEFKSAFTCRNITIRTGGNNYQAHRLKIEVSNDGRTFRSLGRLHPPRHGWQDTDANVTHAIVPTTAKYFRFIYDPSGAEPGAEDLDAAKWKTTLKVTGIELSAEPRIDQYESKSGAVWRVSRKSTPEQLPAALCLRKDQLINISAHLNAEGLLSWKAPKGKWTILRIGHTSTGHTNATGGAGAGLEADKFNPAAIQLQLDKWYGEAMRQAGPELTKEVLRIFHVDSWECGSQNWSPVFREEFLKRRGYDLIPYLPVMAGIPIESAARTEAILYDVRKTIAELVADRFYTSLAGFAKEKGLVFTAESVAPTMLSDGLLHYKKVDVPMGEFWLNSPTHDKPNDMLDAISGAHIYGKNIIQAEAFTTVRMAWNEHPGMLKTLQDRNYALGINKLVYHVFALNPWTDRKPGMTLDGVGLYFQRDQTWWKPGKAWVDYASRTQEILQKGHPVTDIAVFIGEELPRRSVLPDRLVWTLPGIFGKERVEQEKTRRANIGEPMREFPAGVINSANITDTRDWVNPLQGYAYDSFNTDVLLGAVVNNGRVVFPSGANYGMLVFPIDNQMNPQDDLMSNEVLQKLYSLIQEGATVVLGKRPVGSFTVVDEATEKKMKETIAAIWEGNAAIKTLGKGKVIQAPYTLPDFSTLNLQPDVLINSGNGDVPKTNDIAWTHRTNGEEEIYFISNQQAVRRDLELSFRVTGKRPELYDAVSNQTTVLKSFSDHNGRTTIPVRLEANASVFVIFKDKPAEVPAAGNTQNAGDTKKVKAGKKLNWQVFKSIKEIEGSWKVAFDPSFGGPQQPVIFNSLTDWSKNSDPAIAGYSGTAVYTKTITWDGKIKTNVWLDLGKIAHLAEVKVNGVSCGTLWTAPFRLNIGKTLKKGNNLIEIAITNTWANRLIADQALPENKRITQTTAPFRLKGKPLEEAGLLGPVKLMVEDL
ncbi:glycosyl hydrolase [Pedobacter sp. AW31-3R]|uniref:glycosyl hydrolase n=1 Tax=Pedobacter sp. AW31-3R TaxID=3445781 RepID=UPI003F9ECF86